MKKKILLLSIILVSSFVGISQEKKTNPFATAKPTNAIEPYKILSSDSIVEIRTDLGNILVRLYNETPKHRDNFMKLARNKYFDSLMFHRVIKEFMIQGGDPESQRAQPEQMLGNGGPGYTIPAEINTKYFHKKGALSAARLGDEINPNKESSGSQFYIVQGRTFTENDLKATEEGKIMQIKRTLYNQYLNHPDNIMLRNKVIRLQNENKIDSLNMINGVAINYVEEEFKKQSVSKFSEEQLKAYSTIGGAPHLDGGYTVFGEVIEGLDVIDKIAALETGSSDRPKTDIRMFVTIPSKKELKKKK
jgi:cyclophilin family peptidyl-prolyl cis-trans isomerase